MSSSEATSSKGVGAEGVGHLPKKARPAIVTDELTKIRALVLDAAPDEAKVSFTFDSRLHIVIDVKTLEDVVAVELTLPTLGAGMFHDVQRGQAPRHGFGHRVTALVDR